MVMRIVVLINSLFTGGAEYSTLLLYAWMRQRGYKITFVCLKQASPAYDASLFYLNDIVYLPQGSFIKKAKALLNLVDAVKPQLIHSILFDSNMLGRYVRMRRKLVHIESLVNESYSDFRLRDPNVTRLKLECYQLRLLFKL